LEDPERPRRVLIADDDEDTRMLLAEMLSEAPSVELVGSAKDGDEAIKLAGEIEVDVVILDWVMPGSGGSGAAAAIKASHPEIAIIALTGMDATVASYEMMSAGAVGFLEKGCSQEQLIDAIDAATRW